MTMYSATLPALAANATPATVTVGVAEPAAFTGDTVTSITLTAPAGATTITGVATNNPTIAVRQVRNGTVVSTFATLTIGAGTNLVAETPVTIPVTSQPGLVAGDVIDVYMTQNGTGLALTAGLLLAIYVS